MARYRQHLMRSPADMSDPRLNNLAGDLRGLPPAFIAGAELDCLLDDSHAMALALEKAGVALQLTVYPGVLHGFLHYSRMLDVAMQALDDSATALRQAFA
jgi:acetyl esterase